MHANTLYPFSNLVFKCNGRNVLLFIELHEGVNYYVDENYSYEKMEFLLTEKQYDANTDVYVDLVSIQTGEVVVSVYHAQKLIIILIEGVLS